MNKLELVKLIGYRRVFIFTTEGVCAKQIRIEVQDNVIESVEIFGGCPGNGKAVASLVKGLTLEETIERLRGIMCGNKNTSCADQLAIACEMIMDGRLI